MAISKVILNGDTLMDVTLDTVESNKILSGVRATAANGQDITGQIETKTSSNLTASGATVTAPAGYYSSSASKSVATTTHPNPTATINSSTGVVTASHTQGTGYVTGGTTTGTLNLSTQAAKTVTPTESQQVAVSANKYTTGDITVAPIDSSYVGSAVPRRTSSNLTASGATVTAPAGYYASSANKAVASGSVTTPATTITAQPEMSLAIETGLVTATNTKTQNVTPAVSAGYVSEGTAGTITVSGGNTLQLATQAATTVTPSKVEQTAVAAGKYTTGAIKVAAIPSNLLKAYTATITGTGDSYNYVQHNGNTYTSAGTFTFCKGDTINIKAYGQTTSYIYIDDELVEGGSSAGVLTYDFIAPGAPISIRITTAGQGASGTVAITTTKLVITTNGTHATNDISEATVDVHNSLVDMSWAKIKQCVNEGVDPSFLPISTQINDKWTWQGTTYDAPWNVVHYNSHGMYLQWEWLTPEATEFDAKEAIYYVGEDGLAAGTYYITTSSATGVSTWNSKNIQFTLTSACDSGDQFVIASPTSDPTASRTLTVYGFGETTAKQTATTSSGTDGTLLGTMGDKGATNGNCNGVYWQAYGNHCWSQSAIRQWLNSDAPAGEWWEPQNPWDRPPEYATTRPGFLNGCSEEFKAVLEESAIITALDAVSGFENAYEMTYDKIFLSSVQQMYTTPQNSYDLADVEGEAWDYWKEKAEAAGINGYMSQSSDTVRIKYLIDRHDSASLVWLRSPYRNGYSVRCVSSSGSIASYGAYSTYRYCPCCIIKKSTPTYLTPSSLDWTSIKKMTGVDLEIGSQIVDSWTASNNGTVWDVPWDIAHYDDTAMYLHWHYNLPFATPFDAPEALYYVGEEGLPAGTYYITTGSATGVSAWNSKNIQFTLTQACDPGDQFVLSSPSSDPTASRTLTVYGFGETTAKQTITTSSGTDGTLLGTMGNNGATNGNCNGVYWAAYGNHRWSQSNLRTWLNSDSPAGQWFTPMNPWDRPPSYVTYPGFLYGFSSNFKNSLAYSENKTLLDTVSGFTDTYEITQDKIFLPSLEQINYKPEVYDVEGEPWQYYQQLAEDAGIVGRFAASNEALKVFNLENTSAVQPTFLRSPMFSSHSVWFISSSGSVSSVSAYSSYRCCPACKINIVK